MPSATQTKHARRKSVSKTLRLLAVHVSPMRGTLADLAKDIPVHPVTLSGWISQGFVPHDAAKKLEEKYGCAHAPLEVLCPAPFRR